jgi:hypothetical protein
MLVGRDSLEGYLPLGGAAVPCARLRTKNKRTPGAYATLARRFSFPIVPKVEPVARARGALAANHDGERSRKDLTGRVHAQFSAGSKNRFWQDFEAPKFFQGLTQIDFFADEELFVETAGRVEILARREEEGAGAQIVREIKCAENLYEDARPKWNDAAGHDARASAGASRIKRRESIDNVSRMNLSVGVHKK